MERPLKTQIDALAAGPNARRRLIRGAFAAPAIMTVCSGSALANSSSLRCVANQVSAALPVPLVSNVTDNWVRVQLWTQGGSTSYFVRGADVFALKPASTTSNILASDWLAFDIVSNKTGAAGTSSGKQLSNPAKWAAIRVDASGNIVGVGAGSGTAIAGTCWTSFRLAP